MRRCLEKIFLVSIILAFYSSAIGQTQPGLTLGGKFVPKDSFFLFICAGNSAMSGRDPSPDLVSHPHLWKYEIRPKNYDWLPAVEPICVDPYNTLSSPKGGPTMPFLKRLAELYPNYYFGIMQLSSSGWTLQGHFNPGAAEITELLTQAKLLKPNVTIAAFVSMLNLVEVQNNDTANYFQKVVSMVEYVRSELGMPNLPYIHAGYPVNAGSNPNGAKYDTSLATAKSIMRQIAQIPGGISNSSVIPTEGLTICFTCAPSGYYSHYDRAGNVGWGNRTADTVYARKWVPVSQTKILPQNNSIYNSYVSEYSRIVFDGKESPLFGNGKLIEMYSISGKNVSLSQKSNNKIVKGVYIIRKDKNKKM